MEQPLGMHHVRLFLDEAEVFGLLTLVAQTLLMTMQYDIAVGWGNVVGKIYRLGNIVPSTGR